MEPTDNEIDQNFVAKALGKISMYQEETSKNKAKSSLAREQINASVNNEDYRAAAADSSSVEPLEDDLPPPGEQETDSESDN